MGFSSLIVYVKPTPRHQILLSYKFLMPFSPVGTTNVPITLDEGLDSDKPKTKQKPGKKLKQKKRKEKRKESLGIWRD